MSLFTTTNVCLLQQQRRCLETEPLLQLNLRADAKFCEGAEATQNGNGNALMLHFTRNIEECDAQTRLQRTKPDSESARGQLTSEGVGWDESWLLRKRHKENGMNN